MTRVIDMSNRVYGRLTVISRSFPDKNGRAAWLCHCACGNTSIVSGSELRRGRAISCGCLRDELSSERLRQRSTKHGLEGSRTYNSWLSMRQRCGNRNHKHYSYYGGRGITICERWNDFQNFLADMGERPEGKTLDRIDTDGNYCPENCRWATRKEQNTNQRPRAKAVSHAKS